MSMEKHKSSDLRTEKGRSAQTSPYDEVFAPVEPSIEAQTTLTGEEIVRNALTERTHKARRRKWIGRIMIVFGITTMLGSCPFYALSLIPGQSIVAGLAVMIAGIAMIVGGGAFLAWKPRLKDTNEAMIVALKHGNRLTTSRLALEMDISFDRAEKIIQELVRNGIAEIDMDDKDPNHAIVYKIRGF